MSSASGDAINTFLGGPSRFYALNGSIGSITSSGYIGDANFRATGNIATSGGINVTNGGVAFSSFVAGYAFTGGGHALTGTSIGNVSISGEFLGSDLIASIDAVDGTWGNGNDTTAAGGTIGTVTIGLGTRVNAPHVEGYGIEADTLGTVTVNSQAFLSPANGYIDNGAFNVRVFEL